MHAYIQYEDVRVVHDGDRWGLEHRHSSAITSRVLAKQQHGAPVLLRRLPLRSQNPSSTRQTWSACIDDDGAEPRRLEGQDSDYRRDNNGVLGCPPFLSLPDVPILSQQASPGLGHTG
ncbi:hypothetical protein XA68_10635 [Ophiocordyceps unilateralis]|uniref:Uncharacterized protein n=1 Tax=Ophiocordyceps unilateralis TaxID=268505 RepID=A0A2A9PHD7_OPHUN|nr:hypothetical protein XA68_10635 [Ophiocordyceps unilateralis]